MNSPRAAVDGGGVEQKAATGSSDRHAPFLNRLFDKLSLDHVLQQFLVEREVSDDPFSAAVFVFQLIQPTHLRRHQAAIAVPQEIAVRFLIRSLQLKGDLADSRLNTDLVHRDPGLALLDDGRLSCLGELRCPHRLRCS